MAAPGQRPGNNVATPSVKKREGGEGTCTAGWSPLPPPSIGGRGGGEILLSPPIRGRCAAWVCQSGVALFFLPLIGLLAPGSK